MTEQLTAQEEECLERFAAGDNEAFFEFWDLVGVDMRPRPDDVIIRPTPS